MGCHLTIVFADGERIDYELSDAEIGGMDARAAHAWLDREYEGAGCVPSNPVGKLLIADKIVSLAKSQSRRAFDPPSPWVKDFLRATAAALARPLITIDFGQQTLGY
jgi:hypothetical protein